MKYIETEFSKELAALLAKHKKIITSISGIYAIDYKFGEAGILIGQAETASEDSRDRLIFIKR